MRFLIYILIALVAGSVWAQNPNNSGPSDKWDRGAPKSSKGECDPLLRQFFEGSSDRTQLILIDARFANETFDHRKHSKRIWAVPREVEYDPARGNDNEVLEAGTIVQAPGLVLNYHIDGVNNINALRTALEIAAEVDDVEATFPIRRAALEEIPKRLNTGRVAQHGLDKYDVDMLAELLVRASRDVFFGVRRPGGPPGLNPLNSVSHFIFRSPNTLSKPQQILFAAAMFAGVKVDDLREYRSYFEPMAKTWLQMRKGWLGKIESTRFDYVALRNLQDAGIPVK